MRFFFLLATVVGLTTSVAFAECNCVSDDWCACQKPGDSRTSGDDSGYVPPPSPGFRLQQAFAPAGAGYAAVQGPVGGYIDSAIVQSQIRLRFDSASGGSFANRALYQYPIGDPKLDYQEFSVYVEHALTQRLSGFIDLPVLRMSNPLQKDNNTGFGDLAAGFKYSIVDSCDRDLTFQLRVKAPTGDEPDALGTGITSIEPALLGQVQASEKLTLFGEFRVWIPLDETARDEVNTGTNEFGGELLRYGVGAGYELYRCYDGCSDKRLTAVAELVGWSVLDGLKTGPNRRPSDGPATVTSAAGDTIVNAKFGGRWAYNQHTFYAGYGRALTGDVWYEDIIRAEYTILY